MIATIIASITWTATLILHLIMAVAILSFGTYVYMNVTPEDEIALIAQNRIDAAISFIGAVLGIALPIAAVVATSTTIDIVVWGTVSTIIQISVYMIIRKLIEMIEIDEKKLSESMKENTAFAIVKAFTHVIVAIFIASAMLA